MSTLDPFQSLTSEQRLHRYFSDDFKRQKVADIENKIVRIADVCREYQVSKTAVRKWLYKYSTMRKRRERIVLQSDSDTVKIKLLQERIKELERTVGQKQLNIDFLEKMIEIAGEDLKVDIKKKLSSKLSNGSDQIK